MRTKIDALYDLVKKMKGSAYKDDSIVEMIDQVRDGYEPSTGNTGHNLIEIVTDLSTAIGSPGQYIDLEEADWETLNEVFRKNLEDISVYPDGFVQDGNVYAIKYISINGGDYVIQFSLAGAGFIEFFEDLEH